MILYHLPCKSAQFPIHTSLSESIPFPRLVTLIFINSYIELEKGQGYLTWPSKFMPFQKIYLSDEPHS